MRRAKYDIYERDVLAQERSYILYLLGRMPVQPKKQNVSWACTSD